MAVANTPLSVSCEKYRILDALALVRNMKEDQMAFGWPTMYVSRQYSLIFNFLRYYQPHAKLIGSREVWDNAISEANEVYKGRVHNLFCDNCHSHVAYAFNKMRFQDKGNWNMFSVTALLFFHGKYVSKRHCFSSWFPFILVLCVILAIISIILHIS
uniref:Transmembrane protein 222 n=1 Tax=Schistosoma haematobium TaxID=6185 RepID=A0A095ATB2_SCHHA